MSSREINDKPVSHTAAPSFVGYLYQAKYALCLLLQERDGRSIAIERLDDIHFEKEHRPTVLFQLKHHITPCADLTDGSENFWKTIREWSDYIQAGNSIENIRLILITTGCAPEGSVANSCKSPKRDDQELAKRLVDIAQKGGNKKNDKAYTCFLNLSESKRIQLIEAITVSDVAPTIQDLETDINKELATRFRPNRIKAARESIQGWWENRILAVLLDQKQLPISPDELNEKIQDIRDSMQPESLPNNFAHAEVPKDSEARVADRLYLAQLDLIQVSAARKETAIKDFYRASCQRSQWVGDDLLHVHELQNYDDELCEEWRRRWDIINADLPENASEEKKVKEGDALYRWVERDANVKIRPNWQSRYLTCGSYHILADVPKVGWHPDYEKSLGNKEG